MIAPVRAASILACAAFSACGTVEPAVRDQTRSINGIEMFVRSVGDGEPILVINGGPGMDHSYLLPGLTDLGLRRQLVFYDQRGVGRSGGALTGASVSMDNYLVDIEGLRSALQRERIIVMGHSWGGLVAMLYAARFPRRTAGLILINPVEPGFRFVEETNRAQLARRTTEDSVAMSDIVASGDLERGDPAAVNRLLWLSFRTLFADRTLAERLIIDLPDRTARQMATVAELLIGPLGRYDFWPELAGITASTLIVHGREDAIPVSMAEEMMRAIPRAHLAVIDNAGHFPYLERPDEVVTAMEEFLDGL